MQKTITVFGGTGFLGRHIIYALAKTGANIRVATRMPAKAYFLKPAGGAGQVTPFFCDIHDDASVELALEGATHAVNLLGILFEKGRRNTFKKIHVEAAERIARMAKKQNLKLLVHVSSLSASADGTSDYAKTKAEGENKVIHIFPQTAILRPSVVFGSDDDFFNRFAKMAGLIGQLPMIGAGKTKFQPVYVGDVAQAVAHILSSADEGKYYGQIYELGGPRVYTFMEMMELMLRITGQDAGGIELPFWFAKIVGFFCGFLPTPPLTVDQVRVLETDNVLEKNTPGLKDLGVSPTAAEAVLPSYLSQYRQGGRFGMQKPEHL